MILTQFLITKIRLPTQIVIEPKIFFNHYFYPLISLIEGQFVLQLGVLHYELKNLCVQKNSINYKIKINLFNKNPSKNSFILYKKLPLHFNLLVNY
jgi:hypothetical protein